MAIKIQVVIMDDRDYILEYKDFTPEDGTKIWEYIRKWMNRVESTKIHIRKW